MLPIRHRRQGCRVSWWGAWTAERLYEAEPFFSLLQKDVLHRRRRRTRAELRYATVYWIEHTYNRPRRQRGLGTLTPVEFELLDNTIPPNDSLPNLETRP